MGSCNSGGKGKTRNNYTRSPSLDKTINNIIKRTANLKKEQYRIIDDNGNVLLMKQGQQDEVVSTVGEKRKYMNGATSIHNHPNGGTFSSYDLTDFGYGAKEIVVASPEGTYRLINNKVGTKTQSDGWYDMRESLNDYVSKNSLSSSQIIKQANENIKNNKTSRELNAITAKWVKINNTKGRAEADKYLKQVESKYIALTEKRKGEVQAERRRLEVKPYNDFYKKNASKYGFTYMFEPIITNKKKLKKSD